MADIQIAGKKKSSPRVDLTPMVDLGFLLITFFVFTTSISEPVAMRLNVPTDDINDPVQSGELKTLNLVLAGGDKLYYYNGNDSAHPKSTDYSATGLRAIIMAKKEQVRNAFGSDSGIVVLIKPTPQSSYKNTVDVLDEMLICNVKTHVLMDANQFENSFR